MQRTKTLALKILLGCAVLAAPLQAAGENIEVDPSGWDFGEVEVGQAETQTFNLLSAGPTPLWIFSVQITDDDTSSFSITSIPAIPVELAAGESIDAEVTFSPSSVDPHDAFLNIISNAIPPDNDLDVPLSGTGVPNIWGPASSLGAGPHPPSDAVNRLLALLVPAGALAVFKRLRKKR